MRKVKYIPINKNSTYKDLTIGKTYEVIKDINDFIIIVNDKGVSDYYSQYSGRLLEFIDVTIEYRNETINSILS